MILMDSYITGAAIKKFRERKKMTQLTLAGMLHISDKAVSKWETGKGYPDITLIEPLAEALGISVLELLSGSNVSNENKSFNIKKLKFYVCPICGNIITASGEALVSCCGITLPPLEAEHPDTEHKPSVEIVEDEYYISIPHEMSREHYISFIAGVSDFSAEIVKLYPEWDAGARFKIGSTSSLFFYCNRHGLYKLDIKNCRH